MKTLLRFAAVAPLLATLAACGDQVGAWGDENSIVAAVAPELWSEIEDQVYEALEPTVYTVTREKAFTVTHATPGDELWTNMKKFRQMLIVGTADDPVVAQALDKADDDDTGTPRIVQVNNVWARNQLVTILVVEPGNEAAGVASSLEELQTLYDDEYRRWARQKMYISGADTALADTLRNTFGFSMTVPVVYDWAARDDTVVVFRNDNPDPAELIRQITVTWTSPIPAVEAMQGDDMLAWRARLAESEYAYAQAVNLTSAIAGPKQLGDQLLYEIQAAWANPPDSDWPAGGPFILRGIPCQDQDRFYLVDAWLYAPGKEKYEYMIQLQTILDTFRC